MNLKGHRHTMTAKDGAQIGYYHVKPDCPRKGGLILIQEIFGVTDHIKECCDSYAADGYEVVAPALFDRMEPGFEVGYEPRDIVRARKLAGDVDWDLLVQDLEVCVDILKNNGPVFMTGYCFGGSVCWVAACRIEGLAAVSGFYGRLIVEFLGETPKCPTILHFGERDATIPLENVEKIKAAHPTVPLHIYAAGHGFNSDRRDDYDAECASLARLRTLALFQNNGAS
jgi:carboxymethylenebutenolidase